MRDKLKRVRRLLDKQGFTSVQISRIEKNSILLAGRVARWEEKIHAGYLAAGKGFKGVVNDIEVENVVETKPSEPAVQDLLIDGRFFDVVIIGGGVIGSSIARELMRKKLTVALLEKEEDLAMHASSRNDGMIHPGMAASPGSLKASYNVRGNRMYTQAAEELGFELKRPGSVLLYASWWYPLLSPVLWLRCHKNHVDGRYRGLRRSQVAKLEPHATTKHYGGFFMPSAGIVSPYRVTIAYAENAIENGAEFFLNTAVRSMDIENGRIARIHTNRGNIKAGVVVNAAGVWSDKIAAMADDRFFSIHGRKGTEGILDKKAGPLQSVILGAPSLTGSKNSHSKGGGVVPCVEGNLLFGPHAVEVADREDFSTTSTDFNDLLKRLDVNPSLHPSMIINYYSGIRAATYEEDFIIEPSEKLDNLVYAAGIQSPGLASAPAIAEDVAGMAVTILQKNQKIPDNPDFNPHRKLPVDMSKLTKEERAEIIEKNPAFGHIVCRCEGISEGEIREALHRPLPVSSVDGVKRRTRAGAGRCHGGFCLPKILEIMSQELELPMNKITKKGKASFILTGRTREDPPKEPSREDQMEEVLLREGDE